MTVQSDTDSPSVACRGVSPDDLTKHRVLTMARDLNPDGGAGRNDALDIRAERLATSKSKRILDLIGSSLGILILCPLFICVAIAIMLESRGSPLFRQRRTGFGGAPFVIYKFRTMRVREDGANVVQATRDDDRITKVGLLLRRTSIDELPQLLNVLLGEMSLVGPRPHALAHDEYYGARVAGYEERFRTKPGLTGLAQVSGLRGQTADVADMAARVSKDLEYIHRWTFFLDLKILCKTVVIFAFHPAAY